jgi:4-hydroxy-tetrahydrodipicolinate synthase
MKSLGRILTAMITPFDANGNVDIAEAVRIAEYLCANGNDGVVVAGTTGEAPALETAEKLELFAAIKTKLGKDKAVIGGTGGNNTKHSVELTKQAAQTGIDAVLAVVPYYNKPTQDGMLTHFGAIAQAADIPVVLYNVPSRTGQNMLPGTAHVLARRHHNIVGIKESTGSVEQFSTLVHGNPRPDTVTVWCGDDYFCLPALALGAHGVVGVATHLAGPRFRALFDAWDRGDTAAAGAIHRELQPLFTAIFSTTSPIPVKWAMNQLGFRAGACRSPLGVLPDELETTLGALIAPYRQLVRSGA